MNSSNYSDNVFLNCPFDSAYRELFKAMLFAVHYCGFNVRCAFEGDDSSEVRIREIYDIIRSCRYGIHDISRAGIDKTTGLARFNMPLELGVFLGAKEFGRKEQRRKQCLVMDCEQYRYHKFISDIAGQDIKAHKNDTKEIIKVIRNWLSPKSKGWRLQSGIFIGLEYDKFMDGLPQLARDSELSLEEWDYFDYVFLVKKWLKTKARSASRHGLKR